MRIKAVELELGGCVIIPRTAPVGLFVSEILVKSSSAASSRYNCGVGYYSLPLKYESP